VLSLVPAQKKQWVIVKVSQSRVPSKQKMSLDDRAGGQMGASVSNKQ